MTAVIIIENLLIHIQTIMTALRWSFVFFLSKLRTTFASEQLI